jgi:hypothetical protein
MELSLRQIININNHDYYCTGRYYVRSGIGMLDPGFSSLREEIFECAGNGAPYSSINVLRTGNAVSANVFCMSNKSFCTDTGAAPTTTAGTSLSAGSSEWYKFVTFTSISCSDSDCECKNTTLCYGLNGITCETRNVPFGSKDLPEGINNVYYYSYDISNRKGADSPTVSYKVDKTAPSNPLISADKSTLSSSDQVTFTATASDAVSGINEIKIYVDNVLNKTCSSSPCTHSGYYNVGTHNYYMTAADTAGNTATSSTGTLNVVSALSFNSERYLGDICASCSATAYGECSSWGGHKAPYGGGPYCCWNTLVNMCHGTSSGDWYPKATKATGPSGASGCNSGYSRYSCYQEFAQEGSSQISSFDIGYTASGTSCILSTKSSTGSWANRGSVPCDVNQAATITVGTSGYCNAVGRCDVKITAGTSEITRYYNIPYICGDSQCTSGENCENCPGDCPPTQPTCSNSNQWGTCTASSTCSGGAWSCSAQTPSQEKCDGADNDCDGSVDEGLVGTYYRDADGDGYGNPSQSTTACSQPSGYVTNNQDCNDGTNGANIHPPTNRETAAAGLCSNGKDDDCDGLIDLVSGKIDPGCDATPPSVAINSPAAGSTQTANFNVGFSASDSLSGLSSCKLYTKDGAASWTDRGGNCGGTAAITVGAGKYCSAQGADSCGVRIWANDNAGNTNQADRYFSIDTIGPAIGVSAMAYNPGDWIAKENVSFAITCSDLSNCVKLDYSYYNYNYTTKKYNYSLNKFLPAKSISASSITSAYDNATCSPGETCRTRLSITATDGVGNVNTFAQDINKEFKIDMQAPTIEKRECMYKIKGSTKLTNCLAITETTPIFVGSNVTLNAIANDSNGIGVFNISIYIINESGNQILMKTAVADLTPLGRKNGSTTATIKEIGTYKYKIVAEDYLGNVNISDAGSFRIGGSDKVSCKEQGGDLCKEYQACAASIEPANDDDERIGKYCCIPLGNCINRSMLATCAGQSGIIYDPFVYDCSGATVPSSDTIEKNKCCKGTITAKKQSVAWYDMAGNKLAGAARGDKVKCIGASNEAGKYNLTITLGSKIISQSIIPVTSAKRAEAGPVTLIETGTYKCVGIFSSP